MKSIYFSKPYCANKNNNQLLNIINSIVKAIQLNKKVVIIDKFFNEFNNNSYTPISEIININRINNFLIKNYNIFILDKTQVDFKIHSIIYGINNNTIDITEEILTKFSSENNIFIDTNENLNLIKNMDPLPNVAKQLDIFYTINSIPIKETHDERNSFLIKPLLFNLEDEIFINDSIELSKINNKNIFDHILQNIHFTEIYETMNNNFINTFDLVNKKINLIDLQVYEDDDEIKLINKYILLIKKYINKSDLTILVPNKEIEFKLNKLEKFLSEHNYYFKIRNLSLGNEIDNIININLGKKINNLFIGLFNMEELNGSNLSYILINQMNDNVKHVLIDPLDISLPELTNF